MKKERDLKTLQVLGRHIKRKLKRHLRNIGITTHVKDVNSTPEDQKQFVRLSHLAQRQERLDLSQKFLDSAGPKLIKYFASGTEISVPNIKPRLELIVSGTEQAQLFRFASLTWSVPVSVGYGRRLRFLVWDESNGKLMGLIALGDPVFNLRARDHIIGWNASERMERLSFVMDGYVLGAIPPYNMLLAGKLIACLVRTSEVRDYFFARYGKSRGVISRKKKKPRLVMVTTSSALGRSSMYNRLKLNGTQYFEPIGYTAGYGHFHIPSDLFDEMREYLRLYGHKYFGNNRYGNGPNWKIRVIRATLELLGMDIELLHHGIGRELFICRLAQNADQILKGLRKRPIFDGLLSVEEVSNLAIERWLIPRSIRQPEFINWDKKQIMHLLTM